MPRIPEFRNLKPKNLKPAQPELHDKLPSPNNSSNKVTMQQKLLSKQSGLTLLDLLSHTNGN